MSFNEFKKTKIGIAIIIVCALFLNVLGKFIATSLNLPLWLDTFGTCLVAYLYGPVLGAIVGVALNVAYGIFDGISLIFGIVSILLGVACGIMARKKFFETLYGSFFAGFVLALLAIAFSTPIKMILFNGYSSNLWNDGFFEMLLELGFPRWLCAMMGQFAIDFIDKNIITLALYLSIKFYRNKIQTKKNRISKTSTLLCLLLLGGGIKSNLNAIDTSRLLEGFFTTTIFNDANGLLGGEANTVEFTEDGYLWVGTYGGLYQYDGINFKLRHDYKSIKNVNCLYNDSEGRLWIGTNDNGISVRVGDKISNIFDTDNGLSANSVKAIGQDVLGNYYIATTGKLNVVQLNDVGGVVKSVDQVSYGLSIASNKNGLVAVTTNSGDVHIIKNSRYLYQFREQDLMLNSVLFPNNDNILYLGTSSNKILVYDVNENEYEKIDEIETGSLRFIKAMKKDENGIVWVCADNGIGFLDKNKKIVELDVGRFSNSIDSVGIDFQGNMWFTSSRLGLLRVTESLFMNVHEQAKVETDVLNAVTFWNGLWYFGSDDGLDVMNTNFVPVPSPLSERLKGQRVRSLFVDSNNHLWICVASGDGLIEVLPDAENKAGGINTYNSKNGALSNRFRTAVELPDGTIAAGQYTGIDFIDPKNKEVIGNLQARDGLTNPFILSLYADKDGTLYAGTDGGGVAVIRRENDEFKIKKIISRKTGLSSDVILRIVEEKHGDGIFIISGNGIFYLDSVGELKSLDSFPYSNNFDLYEDDNGKMFVISGAGIFVMEKEALLAGGEEGYILLSTKEGLSGSITANSKKYVSPKGELYICCNDGCYVIDTKKYTSQKISYRMIVDYVVSDGVRYDVPKASVIELSGNDKKLVIHPVLLNYTMKDPCVGYCLEGYEKSETIVRSKELGEIAYSNLPNGNYNFKMNLYSDSRDEILESISYLIVKNKRIFEHLWFRIYFMIVCALFVAWCTWMVAHYQNKKILEEQKHKAELAELNAKMSNETIMTIAKTVDAKDSRTSKHSERVAEYSVQIAKKLGWTEDECEDIRKMGLLHDIGKIGIPDAVLNKPGKLTEEEYATMKTHVERGAAILKNFTLVKNVDLGAKYHHERYDGHGYPQGLKGEEIPIYARIIGIADAFDAMTSNRVYRNQLSLDKVVAEFERCKGSQFDPTLTDLFLGLINDGVIDVDVLYK